MKKVTIYTTLVCPYCVRAKKLLEKKGVSYEELRIDLDPALIQEAVDKSGGLRTVPQIFIEDFHVGGCDELYALDTETGSERWKFNTEDKLTGGANWFKDSENRLNLLVGSYDALLYCIDAQTGKPLWKYETGNYINGSPAVGDKYCVFGGCDAVIHIVSTSDGTKAGEIDTGVYIAEFVVDITRMHLQ